MNTQQYLHRLQKIGVRTDKRIEIMYMDLFRITENIFLKECHKTEGFELYEFVKEKEKFRELHELRQHMEALLIWMYPEGLPIWPKSTNRKFKELKNPYLGACYEAISKNMSISNQYISAAFNLRCKLPGEQFRQNREFLLQKLKDRHFSAAAIEMYISEKKDNAHIPKIGLDLMTQEIYLLKPEESFLPEEPEQTYLSTAWYKKYMNIFDKFSNSGLTIYYNKGVEQEHLGPAWKGILKALRDQFHKRKIDISYLGNVEELEMKHCAILIDKELQTADEIPKEIFEQIAMLFLKKKDDRKVSVNISRMDDKNIYYWSRNYECSFNINYLLKFFHDQLLEKS
jgi:hypothetical protein